MGNEEVGLSPVPALGCWAGFVGSSCLKPPKPLGSQSSPMAVWEHFAGSEPCAARSPLLIPCCDLGVGSPAFLWQPLPGQLGKTLPQQLPDPAAWLPAGLEGGESSPLPGECERGAAVLSLSGADMSPARGWDTWQGYGQAWPKVPPPGRGCRRGASLSSGCDPFAFKAPAFLTIPLASTCVRLGTAWWLLCPPAGPPCPCQHPLASPLGREGCTDSWVLPSSSPGAL